MLTALWGCNRVPLLPDSSLSQWVHACDALDLPMLQREELDAFIDQLYKDMEKGEPMCCLQNLVVFLLREIPPSVQGLGEVPTGDRDVLLVLLHASRLCYLWLTNG